MIQAMAFAVCLAGQCEPPVIDPYGRRQILVVPVTTNQHIPESILRIADGVLDELCRQSINYFAIPHAICEICKLQDSRAGREKFIRQLRIGQSLRADSLFDCRIVAFRDSMTSSEKYYRKVLLELKETDIDSGVVIANGTAVLNDAVQSPYGDRSTLRAQLLRTAIARAMRDLQSRILPPAIILTIKEDAATISKGSNDGYKKNLTVIVLRGRSHVGTGIVDTVQTDVAIARFERFTQAPRPGDRVIPVSRTEVPLNCWKSEAPGKK